MVITIPGVLTSHFVHSGALWNEGNPYAVLQWPLTQTQIKSVMNSSIGRYITSSGETVTWQGN